MSFTENLYKRVHDIGYAQVIKGLGYQSYSEQALERLKSVVNSPLLGLDESHFDFKYSNVEFITALADLCAIDADVTADFIEQTTAAINEQKNAYKPFIFIDTHFKRTTQPIFALAATEHWRYIFFDDDFTHTPAVEQVVKAVRKVRAHHRETRGDIGHWGYAKSYFFIYEKDKAIQILPSGQIVGIHENYSPDSKAIIEHKGRELDFSH